MKQNILIAILLIGSPLFSSTSHNPHITVETISQFQKKEIIEGVTFIFAEKTINGVSQQSWSINGVAVDANTYQSAILEAEKELRRKQREQEEQRRLQEQESKHQAMSKVHKKMLASALDETEQWIHKLYAHNLMPFLVFDTTTIASKESFDQLTQLLIPSARALLAAPSGASTRHDIDHALTVHFADLPDRLSRFFHATVHQAIDTCNDTKTLKNLLELTTQA